MAVPPTRCWAGEPEALQHAMQGLTEMGLAGTGSRAILSVCGRAGT